MDALSSYLALVLGAVLGAGGTFLVEGAVWRRDHVRRWDRDNLVAYARLLDQANRLTHAQAGALRRFRRGADVTAEAETLNDSLWEINYVLEEIDLLAPADVVKAAKQLRSTLEARNGLLRDEEPPTTEQWDARFKAYQSDRARLLAACRRHLAVDQERRRRSRPRRAL